MKSGALSIHRNRIDEAGFDIADAIYSDTEIDALLSLINRADTSKETFRKSTGLFAIRQFLKEVPATIPLIFNHRLKTIISEIFGPGYFPVKSIYFDKPEDSNWFVAYHQDLTISVNKKMELQGYGPWTVKQDQFAVQPPLEILQNNFTIRIHLDDTDEFNGALRVINGSHHKGIFRTETIDLKKDTENICRVKKGGIMIMKPLLMHASDRSISHHKRRVIHIEFSNVILPKELGWSEKILP
jgi:hypothetical protein